MNSCAQIMYSFILRPDTLPRSYSNWLVHFDPIHLHFFSYLSSRIQAACKVPRDAVTMNRSLVRDGFFDVSLIDGLLAADVSVPVNPDLDQAPIIFLRTSLHKTEPNFSPAKQLPLLLYLTLDLDSDPVQQFTRCLIHV